MVVPESISSLVPSCNNNADKVALLVHTINTEDNGFVLNGLLEDDSRLLDSGELPPSWNHSDDGVISFRYWHPEQAETTFYFKIIKFANHVVVHGLSSKATDQIYSIELRFEKELKDLKLTENRHFEEAKQGFKEYTRQVVDRLLGKNQITPEARENRRNAAMYGFDPLMSTNPSTSGRFSGAPGSMVGEGYGSRDLFNGPSFGSQGGGIPATGTGGSMMGHQDFANMNRRFTGGQNPNNGQLPGTGGFPGVRFDPLDPLGNITGTPDFDEVPFGGIDPENRGGPGGFGPNNPGGFGSGRGGFGSGGSGGGNMFF